MSDDMEIYVMQKDIIRRTNTAISMIRVSVSTFLRSVAERRNTDYREEFDLMLSHPES